MGILQDLVAKLQGFQGTTDSEPAVETCQEGSDLFLEINQQPAAEANKDQVRKTFYRDSHVMDYLLALCYT